MAAIRQVVGDRAMVCGFLHEGGMWRLVAVTAAVEPNAPSILMMKQHGQEPLVTVYYSIEVCDRAFLRFTDGCVSDGYQFMGQVEIPLPDLLFDPMDHDSVAVMEQWANQLLRSASFKLEPQNWML
jgi:hypothetical protein